MKRRFLLILLAACLGLTACQGQTRPDAASGTEAPATEKPLPATTEAQPAESTEAQPADEPADLTETWGFTDLDSQLIAWLRANGMEEESFTVSPLSFKAALALTALGAEGETQRQLLDTLGFRDTEELTAWYASVLTGTAAFESGIWGEDKAGCAYRVVNAIFHNAACDGAFRESYKDLAASAMGAYASSHDPEAITQAINDWVNAQTEGMIPSVVQDASQSAAVLVNALYLKTKWLEPFADGLERDFTTVTGATVKKEFITKTESMRYHGDEACQIVEIPLQGGVYMALILGEPGDLAGKLDQAEFQRVRVTLPKFEVETSLDQKELVRCLMDLGCGKLFADGGVAEFDPMFTEEIFVDDIIQKAKVSVDEKGLEAAAATAVIMVRSTAMPNPEEPVDFTADHPFRFVVYRQDETPELLFWGQVMD